MNWITAILVPAIVCAVVLKAAQVWKPEINALLRRIERY